MEEIIFFAVINTIAQYNKQIVMYICNFFTFLLNYTLCYMYHASGKDMVGWLVVWGLTALWDSISVYIGPSPKEREKEEG